jgi:ABC-type antimicrobial peptide transport system permease subunit
MSWILIRVVNAAFFGWTIDLFLPWAEVLATPLWVIPVAVLSSIYPAWKASRLDPIDALRYE